MKATIISTFYLSLSRSDVFFYIEADSSSYTMEAVLSQESKIDDKWYLVAFFSKSLFPIEYNYEIYNKKIVMGHLNTNNFSFSFLLLLDNEEAYDTTVT